MSTDHPRGVFRRLGWGVGDQAVSSLSNFALSVVLAHALSARGFGAFSLVYVTYALVVSACRGLATDPLLVIASRLASAEHRAAESAAAATAFAVGVLTGAVSVGVGLLVGGTLGAGFVALGVGLPGLMLQDSWRFIFFARGDGRSALVNDVVWGVTMLGGLVVLGETGTLSSAGCILVFGGTAWLAAAVGGAQARTLPDLSAIRGWVREHAALGTPFLVENVALGGARQLRAVAVGAVVGLAPVGWIRGAEVLMGPFLVVLMGVAQVAVPEAGRVLRRTPERLLRFCLGLGAVQAVAAAAWGIAIVLLLPHGLGQLMLGDIWRPAGDLLVPVTLQFSIACFCTGAGAGLRAMGAARRSLGSQLAGSALYLVGGIGGAFAGGALGSSWGLAISQALAALVWWAVLTRTHRAWRPDVVPTPAQEVVS